MVLDILRDALWFRSGVMVSAGPGVFGGGGGGILGIVMEAPLTVIVVLLPVDVSLKRRLMPGIMLSGSRIEEARDDDKLARRGERSFVEDISAMAEGDIGLPEEASGEVACGCAAMRGSIGEDMDAGDITIGEE